MQSSWLPPPLSRYAVFSRHLFVGDLREKMPPEIPAGEAGSWLFSSVKPPGSDSFNVANFSHLSLTTLDSVLRGFISWWLFFPPVLCASLKMHLTSFDGTLQRHSSTRSWPFASFSSQQMSRSPDTRDGRHSHQNWRESFLARLESLLHRSDDLMLSLPYTHIRQNVTRLATVLDTVSERDLVPSNSADPSSPIIDAHLKRIIDMDYRILFNECEREGGQQSGGNPSVATVAIQGMIDNRRVVEEVKRAM